MERKYYTGEQILEALSEVGVGAGDISEVMSCLSRMSLNNNSTKVDRKNDDLIRKQDAIDSMYDLVDGTERPESQKGSPHIYQIVDALERVPSVEKTGKWIRHPIYPGSDHYYYACSECDYRSWSQDNYCSVCGAKMERE